MYHPWEASKRVKPIVLLPALAVLKLWRKATKEIQVQWHIKGSKFPRKSQASRGIKGRARICCSWVASGHRSWNSWVNPMAVFGWWCKRQGGKEGRALMTSSFPMGGSWSDMRVRVKWCCAAAVSVTGVKPPPVPLARAAKCDLCNRFIASLILESLNNLNQQQQGMDVTFWQYVLKLLVHNRNPTPRIALFVLWLLCCVLTLVH